MHCLINRKAKAEASKQIDFYQSARLVYFAFGYSLEMFKMPALHLLLPQ